MRIKLIKAGCKATVDAVSDKIWRDMGAAARLKVIDGVLVKTRKTYGGRINMIAGEIRKKL